MAKRFLPALRTALGGRAASGVETKGLAERVRSQSVAYTVSGTPYQNNWNVDRAVREGFQANPWIFRAVEVIAHSALDRKIVLRQDDPDTGQLIPSGQDPSRLLFRLNRQTNPWEVAELFRYRLYAQALLSSRGVFIEVTRSRAGSYSLFTLLDPDLVDIIPTSTNPIASFRITTTGDTGGRLDYLPPFDPDDPDQDHSVLWVRSPHPTILTRGMSPMEAAGLTADLDRYARLYNRDYMQAGGRPGGILGVKGAVTPGTLEELQRRFNHNARPGETSAIQADAMFYQDLSTTPRDIQWGEVMDRSRKEASMIFGVPESMMGDASGRTFDNADAEYAIFMEHRLRPFLRLIDAQLDPLTGGAADDLYLRHDLSDVWVLQRHRRADEDRMAADLDRGAISYNEYREFKHLPPVEAPWAKVCWIGGGKAAGYMSAPEDAANAAQAPMLGQPLPGAAEGTPGEAGPQPGNAPDPAQLASYNAQTNAGAANLRQLAAGGQGRSPAGGMGALEAASLEAALAPRELEGKESRARSEQAAPPAWR